MCVTLRLAGVQPKQIAVALGISVKNVDSRLAKYGREFRSEYFAWANIARWRTLRISRAQLDVLGAVPVSACRGAERPIYGCVSADGVSDAS
jgi:hypothetical protein